MGATVQSAPAFLPDSAERIMTLSEEDFRHRRRRQHCARPLECSIPLYIGVFFDGTNNNRERDEPGRGHSNVVRLFNAHLAVDAPNPELRTPGHYRIYIPGVGTRFQEGEEWRESMEGKSMAKGGQARILFGVLEVVNAVHKAFSDDIPLIAREDLPARLRDYVRRVDEGIQSPDGETSHQRESRRAWMQRLNQELLDALRLARKERPRVQFPFIRVNVFGFSRGAAQARAFCHWIHDLLGDGKLGGVPLQIGFVGLFDCVASVGLSDSVRRSIIGLNFADGHFGWAKEILGEVPTQADCTVHMVAGLEQRLNFPLTRMAGDKVIEIVYPGVHSDIGGGYNPGDQGRAKTEDALLSQIPLAQMHRLARKWDVPLQEWTAMKPDLRADYAIAPVLIERWNAYMAAADADWQLNQAPTDKEGARHLNESRDLQALIRQHRRMYLSWRRVHLHDHTMAGLLARLKADAQDTEDQRSYNALLAGDLRLLRARREAIARNEYKSNAEDGGSYSPIFIDEALRRGSNYLPQVITRWPSSREDAQIQWALEQFEGEGVRGEAHLALLSHHVHDSLAGFYLMGYMTPEDKAEKLLAIVRQGRQRGAGSLEPYQRQVFENYDAGSKSDLALLESIDGRLKKEGSVGQGATDRKTVKDAEAQYCKDSIFSPVEQQRAAEMFPKQTDAHAASMPDGIENVVRLVTRTRREGGGYLLPRAIFQGGK